ncbi:MAG TPA: 16S rRNA (guanine(966)-N(2))-methyltransferase RsmD [Firmicutes bacterium]|nr:16S rRNA (guanine(966)-N(2))-methyltransferase RsmD [Bacillota bacterium]
MKNKLKVITGKYKGKQLDIPDNEDIRPTQNYLKEAIFNTIQFEIEGASFLDMYAGTGSIGIEAISRGALFVDFIDESFDSISTIKKNLHFTDEHDDYRIIKYKISSKSQCSPQFRKYDFIFMDPPYKRGYIKKGLMFVERCHLLATNGVLIIESLENEEYDTPGYRCFKDVRYSKKIVRFLKKE